MAAPLQLKTLFSQQVLLMILEQIDEIDERVRVKMKTMLYLIEMTRSWTGMKLTITTRTTHVPSRLAILAYCTGTVK